MRACEALSTRALAMVGGGAGQLWSGAPVRGAALLAALLFLGFVVWFWRGVAASAAADAVGARGQARRGGPAGAPRVGARRSRRVPPHAVTERRMALTGTLEDFGIAEILQLIGQQAKTGVLHLHGRGDEIHIAIADGCVVRAEAAGRKARERLGNMLVRAELIRPERPRARARPPEAHVAPARRRPRRGGAPHEGRR